LKISTNNPIFILIALMLEWIITSIYKHGNFNDRRHGIRILRVIGLVFLITDLSISIIKFFFKGDWKSYAQSTPGAFEEI
jgi:NhaP-type Na+/H+ or K+/H+ antiporter